MPRLAQIKTWPVGYPFEGHFKFFTAPAGLPAGRRTVVVRITADDGTIGWGQAVPSPRWSYETPETVWSTIEDYLAPELIGAPLDDPDELARRMNRAIAGGFSTGQPIAKGALDMAWWDWRGRSEGKSVVDLWRERSPAAAGRRPAGEVTLSWTLNPSSLDEVEPAVALARSRGYRHFNVKVAPDARFDRELCRRVRKLVPDGFLWADANGGYDLDTALTVAPQLADCGIAALEQPLPPNALAGFQRLRQQGALPILMDEGIVSCRDFDEFHALGLLDGVAVKVARMGFTEAARLVDRLEETGSLFYASGLTDPDISLAASLALFGGGALGLPAALNGPQFLHGSILGKPFSQHGDRIVVPPGPGFGVEVDEEKLASLAE